MLIKLLALPLIVWLLAPFLASAAISATQIRPHETRAGEITFYWTQARAVPLEVDRCDLYVGKTKVGQMVHDAADDRWIRGHTFAKAGTYELKAVCYDENNSGIVTSPQTVTVAPVIDRTLPGVGSIFPTTAIAGQKTGFAVSAADAAGLHSCLFVTPFSRTPMTLIKGGASVDYTFSPVGGHGTRVECTDKNGNINSSKSQTILVLPEGFKLLSGQLLKLACDEGRDVNHPCTSVYFYGLDKKRHAFPNENVYKSWYTDFKNVVEIPAEILSGIPLGKNAAYRAGVYLVKFQSSNRVYAVDKKAQLRPIESEQAALAVFGQYWKKMIHDMSDAFFAHYTVGTPIKKSGDYDRTKAYNSVKTLGENF